MLTTNNAQKAIAQLDPNILYLKHDTDSTGC